MAETAQTETIELGKFERYLVEEFYDDYRAGEITRRTFIRRVAYITGSMGTAALAMAAVGCSRDELPAKNAPIPAAEKTVAPPPPPTPSPTAAVTLIPVPGAKSPLSVAENDPAVVGKDVKFEQAGGYLVLPAAASTTKRAAIMVCHENAGLTPHIRDVARRFAKAGFAAIALDLLTKEGGTASMERDKISGALTTAGIPRHVADFAAARKYLGTVDGVDGARVGMIGFCFGGGVTWAAATLIPELKAVVPFYGPAPDAAAAPNIKAAALGVYGGTDARINAGIDPLKAALTAAKVTHEIKIYPEVPHGFHNDTGTGYNEAQSTQAWKDAIAWFQKYV